MRKSNVLCASLGFLVVLMAAYFGSAVYNAGANEHITHLNEFDNIHYYDAEEIPRLGFQAAMMTLPFVLIILVFEFIIAFKSTIRQVKNIAIGLAIASLFIAVMSLLFILYPYDYSFALWGYVWIAMGVFIVAGNAISIFIKGNK